MNGLRKIGARFQMPFYTVVNKMVMGQMLSLPDTSRVSNFLSARRYFRTFPDTNLVLGDVLVANGKKYVVAEHGDGFYLEPIYTHFKLFEVDVEAVWYKKAFTTDTVTGIKTMTRSLQTDKVYMSLQPKSQVTDEISIPQQTFTAVVNREVDRDDILDGKVVTKVDHVLGVYLVELKEV